MPIFPTVCNPKHFSATIQPMQHPILQAEKRETLGKQVKQLRKSGKLPGNIFGKHVASQSVQVAYTDFLPLYKEVGETGIIDLTVNGKAVPVLIKTPQFHVLTHQPLHVDFFQVNLKEKIKTHVPIKLIGEPLPVSEKQGLLLQMLNEIEIEALPEELPEAIEADTSTLAAVGEMLEVADIKAPSGVTILTDPSQAIAQIAELVVEEKEPVLTVEEAPVEGETATEGETPAEPTESPTNPVQN